MVVRLSVNINDATAAYLRCTTKEWSWPKKLWRIIRRQPTQIFTVTEKVRRAISLYKYLLDMQAKGYKIRIVDKQHNEATYIELL